MVGRVVNETWATLRQGVLYLESHEALGLADLHASVPGLPAIEPLLGGAVCANRTRDPGSRLVHLEAADDLLVWVTPALRSRSRRG